MNILIVAAHPDDEILGVGGTAKKYVDQGKDVITLILSDGISARTDKKEEIQKHREKAENVHEKLGSKELILKDFPDQTLDNIELKKLARPIEKTIDKYEPELVFTHHKGDVNQDHRQVFEASLIATRPTRDNPVKKVLSYEVPSATEWRRLNNDKFLPQVYINMSDYLDDKIEIFNDYFSEVEKYPHPRSEENIKNLAKVRGSNVGFEAAEAFELIREKIE